MTDLQTIVAMLGYRRPAGSKTERRFIADWIKPLGMSQDKCGNLYKRIGDSPILWSCHTDTVHKAGGQQAVRLLDGIATVADHSSNCLGADDTAGAWLMREMILAERPGLYVFHRGEEIGGVGSYYIATRFAALLIKSPIAIAFDRRGTQSIITHQAGGRCCSDAFAYSLGNALAMGHRPDSGGTFTDTANYMDQIAECTNISVGYNDEHTRSESLDTNYLLDLRDALLTLDGRDLIVERKPGELDPDDWTRDSWYSGLHSFSDADQMPISGRSTRSLYQLVRDNPNEVADFLEGYGFGRKEIEDAILERGGIVQRR
jgi:hypothetical protein